MKRISVLASICIATLLCGCSDDPAPVHSGHEGESYTDFTDQKTGRQYRVYEGKDGTISWFDIATGSMVGSMAGNAISGMLFNNGRGRDRDRDSHVPSYVPPTIAASNLNATHAYSPSVGSYRIHNVSGSMPARSSSGSSGIVARGSSFSGMNVGG